MIKPPILLNKHYSFQQIQLKACLKKKSAYILNLARELFLKIQVHPINKQKRNKINN